MPDDVPPYAELPVDPDLPLEQALSARPRGRRNRRWDIVLVVAAGGALGGGARWALNQLWPTTPGGFPWSTLVENVLGCLLLGFLLVFLVDVWPPTRYARPFLGIGVLGGFTTFSAYTADTGELLRAGQPPTALVYLFGTLALALAATWAGLTLARAAAGLSEYGSRRRTP